MIRMGWWRQGLREGEGNIYSLKPEAIMFSSFPG